MTWAERRKMLYIMIVTVVCAGVLAIFLYRALHRDPTCFDTKQNGDESGVDCGGSCLRLCSDQARSMVLLWARALEVVPGIYNMVVYFENQNPTSGIRQLPYEIKAYDANNILVAEPVRGTAFIGPNQRSALFVPSVQTGNRIPETVFFRFLEQPKWDTVDQTFAAPLVVPRNQRFENLPSSSKVTADAVNTSFLDLDSVTFVAILYDRDGNAVAASQTVVDAMPQGSTVPIAFTWPRVFETPPARIEIIPRINPFLPHGR